jgi:hypothetical protein
VHTFVCECCYLQLKMGRRPNATCPWTKHRASKCKVMPEEWGVSKLAPAQVEGWGGALFQECLEQKVIPGVKIYQNFIKHPFSHDIDQIHVKERKKEVRHFEKQKVHRSIHFSFWKTHLKIHLKEPKVHSFTSNTLQFCFLIGLSVGKRGWQSGHMYIHTYSQTLCASWHSHASKIFNKDDMLFILTLSSTFKFHYLM